MDNKLQLHTEKVLKGFNERFSGMFDFHNWLDKGGVSPGQVKEYITDALAERDAVIVGMLEEEKKSVKQLFPDAIAKPTSEFATFVIAKDQYNRALNDAITLIQGKENL